MTASSVKSNLKAIYSAFLSGSIDCLSPHLIEERTSLFSKIATEFGYKHMGQLYYLHKDGRLLDEATYQQVASKNAKGDKEISSNILARVFYIENHFMANYSKQLKECTPHFSKSDRVEYNDKPVKTTTTSLSNQTAKDFDPFTTNGYKDRVVCLVGTL